ncbi:uncharacterized protein V6R79_004806 [Siganus canaliculatus]
MVDNIIRRLLMLVVISAAHMALNGPSRAEVTGIAGASIRLQFTFNASLSNDSNFAVYLTDNKIAEYNRGQTKGNFVVSHENTSVFLHITNLKVNDSGLYHASLFDLSPLPESEKVQLIVQEEVKENRSTTVPPEEVNTHTKARDIDGSSSILVFVLVVSPVLLVAAALTCLIWCLLRTRDKPQSSPPQQSSSATIQEAVDEPQNKPSVIYSVLDFPKRPSAVLEMNSNDTEYAAVSYLHGQV